MNAESKARTAPSITGHMIALDAGHSIAIYERNGEHYVAEFRGGRGTLEYAATWFRFYAGALRYRHVQRAALQPSTPLEHEILQIIERLHAESEARQERMRALPRNVATVVRRCLLSAMAWTRSFASKTRRTVA